MLRHTWGKIDTARTSLLSGRRRAVLSIKCRSVDLPHVLHTSSMQHAVYNTQRTTRRLDTVKANHLSSKNHDRKSTRSISFSVLLKSNIQAKHTMKQKIGPVRGLSPTNCPQMHSGNDPSPLPSPKTGRKAPNELHSACEYLTGGGSSLRGYQT